MTSKGSYIHDGRNVDPRRKMTDYEANNSFYRRVEDKHYGVPESPISPGSNTDSSDSSIGYRFVIAPSRQYDSRGTSSPEVRDRRFSYLDHDIGRIESDSESKNFDSPTDQKVYGFNTDPFSSMHHADRVRDRSHLMQSQESQNVKVRYIDAKETNAEDPRLNGANGNDNFDSNSVKKSYNIDLNRVQNERTKESRMKNEEDEIRTNNQNKHSESEHLKDILNMASVDSLNLISFLQGVDRHVEEEADLDQKVLLLRLCLLFFSFSLFPSFLFILFVYSSYCSYRFDSFDCF